MFVSTAPPKAAQTLSNPLFLESNFVDAIDAGADHSFLRGGTAQLESATTT